MARGWREMWEDSDDGLFIRQVAPGAFFFIEWLDMDAHTGRDNEGRPRYVVSLEYVDIARISEHKIRDAIGSCGWQNMDEANPEAIAEACRSYGLKAPLWDVSTSNRTRGIREAKAEAASLLRGGLDAAMGRRVNQIGSTADEFMRGDLDAAMNRAMNRLSYTPRAGWAPGGAAPQFDDDGQPTDWLPYLMGYYEGLRGTPLEADVDDYTQTYLDGHARGLAVRKGKARPPKWIKA